MPFIYRQSRALQIDFSLDPGWSGLKQHLHNSNQQQPTGLIVGIQETSSKIFLVAENEI